MAKETVDESVEQDVKGKQRKRIMQPAGCRSYMRKRLADEFPKIVDGFIDEAKKGSCTHVKMATELLQPTRKGTTRKKSVLKKLLEDMRKVP